MRQRFEIEHSEEVYVGRIVPFVREKLGFGSAAGPQMRPTHAPMAEIGECHDGMPPDAQHALQNLQRVAGFLQSLAEDYIVERAVGIIFERGFEIALIHRYAARDSLL